MTVANARAAKPNARAGGDAHRARAERRGSARWPAAPGELKGYAQRQIISEFGGAGEGSITVGAMLENDGLFSLTQMLGDVSEGAAAAEPRPSRGRGRAPSPGCSADQSPRR